MTKITVKESELRSLVKGVVGKQVNEWRSRDSNADAWADLETNGAASQQRQKVKDMYAKKRDQSIDNSHVPEYYSTYENGYVANINGYTQNQIDAMNDESRSGMERSVRDNFDNEDYFNESKLKSIITKVIKESTIQNLRVNEAFYNKEDGLAYKLMDVVRSIFNSKDSKMQRDEVIQLMNRSKPLYIARFFGDETLVMKVGNNKYMSLKLDRSPGYNQYYGDLAPIGDSEDVVIVNYYNNIEIDETPKEYPGSVGMAPYQMPKGSMDNAFKLPSKPSNTIQIAPDLKLLNIFYAKLKDAKNNSQTNESVIKEGVARNIPKIEKYVNQINELIAQAIDSDSDKIGVIWPNGTWDEPFTYDPIIYRNGALKIVSYSPHSNHGEPNVDIIRSRDMEYDGVPTLQTISRMFKKAVKNKDKYSNVNPDMSECNLHEGFEELIPVAAGTAGIFLASAGIGEVMNALRQGKLGEKGQKLAEFLENLSKTTNKQENYPQR